MVQIPVDSPFHPDNADGYAQWRTAKLAAYPALEDMMVEIADPFNLSSAERAQIVDLCGRANMAMYRVKGGDVAESALPMAVLRQVMSALRVDRNEGADEEGVSALTLRDDPPFKNFIPYKAQAIQWHTDGYYNVPERTIRGMALHCARQAQEGGENDLLDHELMYIRLRDQNPDFIRVLMAEDAMSIPARTNRAGEVVRAECVGPVFSVDGGGYLHMRYTARTVSIGWKAEAADAVKALEAVLKNTDEPYAHHVRMEPGIGLICNNVLHTRTGFDPSDNPDEHRLMYRIRCLDRVDASS
ncbi:TauD/TfdA family dioxygenase [Magnetococcus sp. PR-3]|uniref:TauD/TfdA family dioxygenase n=1 Tax=Magnetococcus sp. PR-3 TaxID=3120355 RepID=UPI002FCE1BF0